MAQGENIVAMECFRAEPSGEPRRGGKELTTGTELLHGQYTLMGYLDSGGFGITYRAIDSLGRSVVLKECFPGELCVRAGLGVRVSNPKYARDFTDILGQFVSEARSLAKLRHRGIVEVHQVFMENETAYIAMEHVEGPDLLSLIEDSRRTIRPTEIERLAIKLLKAIGYVHKRGLLHRDISPDNILIERGGQPKLIDFGAVRGHDTASDESGYHLKCVKDGYSPDEFYDPMRRHGFESDIYSLGATLHHMITGSAPVDAEMRRRAIEQGQGDPFLPLEGRYRGYTRGFLRSIDKALSFRPEDRHATARDWAKFIAAAANERPVASLQRDALYDEHTDQPESDQAEETSGRDFMPWIGVAAAAAGVALSLFGPTDFFATTGGRDDASIPELLAPVVDSRVTLSRSEEVATYSPAGVPGPAALEKNVPIAFDGQSSAALPIIGAAPDQKAPSRPESGWLPRSATVWSSPDVTAGPHLQSFEPGGGISPAMSVTIPPDASSEPG